MGLALLLLPAALGMAPWSTSVTCGPAAARYSVNCAGHSLVEPPPK